MAKGQMLSNREARKPKQEKAPVRVEATFANQKKDPTKSSPAGRQAQEIKPKGNARSGRAPFIKRASLRQRSEPKEIQQR